MIRIFLAGEGPNELGGWAAHPGWREDPPSPGFITAILSQIRPEGWEIGGARLWKDIRKLKKHAGLSNEAKNVRAIALDAREAECDLLVFVRDGDADPARVCAEIQEGIDQERTSSARLVGAVAIPKLEGWILAIGGARETEDMTPGKAQTRCDAFIPPKDTPAMVAWIESHGLTRIPGDATGLRNWLELLHKALIPAP